MKHLGKRFNRMTVIQYTEQKGPHWYVDALCDCGTIKTVRISHLTQGRTKSCGCLQQENRTTHGMWGTTTYRAWEDMSTMIIWDGEEIREVPQEELGLRRFSNVLSARHTLAAQHHNAVRVSSPAGESPEWCWAVSDNLRGI